MTPARQLTPAIDRARILDSLFFIASGGAAMRDATAPAVRARALITKLRERCNGAGAECGCGMHRRVRP